LGNALYRTGQMTEKSDPKATIEKWTEAVKAYDTALQLRADDADSKFNRDLVNRKLDALRQPPPPPHQGSGQGNPPPKGSPPPPGSKPPSGNPPPPQDKPPNGNPPPPQGSPPATAPHPPPGEPPPQRQNPPAGGPGRMSQEEARELLDSEKGDERHSLAVPLERPGADEPPEKPYKNW
jgi:hypothetical protein